MHGSEIVIFPGCLLRSVFHGEEVEYLDLMVPTHVNHFVVEDYQVHRTAGDPNGLRIIGAIEMWAHLNGRKPVILQPAAGRKQIVSDDALKRLGWYLPGEPLRNAKESVRHGAIWLKKQKNSYLLEKGWRDA